MPRFPLGQQHDFLPAVLSIGTVLDNLDYDPLVIGPMDRSVVLINIAISLSFYCDFHAIAIDPSDRSIVLINFAIGLSLCCMLPVDRSIGLICIHRLFRIFYLC